MPKLGALIYKCTCYIYFFLIDNNGFVTPSEGSFPFLFTVKIAQMLH